MISVGAQRLLDFAAAKFTNYFDFLYFKELKSFREELIYLNFSK